MNLDRDFTGGKAFRALAAGLPRGTEQAAWVWLRLWAELDYAADDAAVAGWLSEGDLAAWLQEFAEVDREAIRATLTQAGGLLVQQADGGWYCPRWVAVNRKGGSGERTQAQRGGDMRVFHAGLRRAEAEAPGMSLLLGDDVLRDEQEQPLQPETVRRYYWLVRVLDGALFRGDRPPHRHTREMVLHALPVLVRYSDTQLADVGRRLALRRGEARLALMTTEKLLPVFEAVAKGDV